jgi:hypothetical protein
MVYTLLTEWQHGLKGIGLRPLACWDCGRESLSFVSVVCCQAEFSASGWSLVRTSPTECGVYNWVRSWSPGTQEPLAPLGTAVPWKEKHSSTYLDVRTVHLVEFMIQASKCTNIFYISSVLLHVSMHPHHLKGILYFAKVSKISRLKCDRYNSW